MNDASGAQANNQPTPEEGSQTPVAPESGQQPVGPVAPLSPVAPEIIAPPTAAEQPPVQQEGSIPVSGGEHLVINQDDKKHRKEIAQLVTPDVAPEVLSQIQGPVTEPLRVEINQPQEGQPFVPAPVEAPQPSEQTEDLRPLTEQELLATNQPKYKAIGVVTEASENVPGGQPAVSAPTHVSMESPGTAATPVDTITRAPVEVPGEQTLSAEPSQPEAQPSELQNQVPSGQAEQPSLAPPPPEIPSLASPESVQPSAELPPSASHEPPPLPQPFPLPPTDRILTERGEVELDEQTAFDGARVIEKAEDMKNASPSDFELTLGSRVR